MRVVRQRERVGFSGRRFKSLGSGAAFLDAIQFTVAGKNVTRNIAEPISTGNCTARKEKKLYGSYIANASIASAPNHARTVCIAVSESFCVNSSAKRLFGREQAT